MNDNDPTRRASATTWNLADICRKFVVRKLQAAGWDEEPHSIAEQRAFTDGRIVVHGNRSTPRLLITGLDAPDCRNVMHMRLVTSMVEFCAGQSGADTLGLLCHVAFNAPVPARQVLHTIHNGQNAKIPFAGQDLQVFARNLL